MTTISSLPVCARQMDSGRSAGERSRIAPPVSIECDRNQLTSYNGRVADYHRSEDFLTITINTDWGTVETVTLIFNEKNRATDHFLMNGHAFTEDDWVKVEVKPGILVTDIRAFVWVCLDEETPPVIDWRPQQ